MPRPVAWLLTPTTTLDPTKYFGSELGAQTKCDAANSRYIVNGAHDAPRLQVILDGFIQRFVLCPLCDNPETDLVCTVRVLYATVSVVYVFVYVCVVSV